MVFAMQFHRLVVALLLFIPSPASLAQPAPTQQSIQTRLQQTAFLMIRARLAGEHLIFDAQGNAVGKPQPAPLPLCAVKVVAVTLTDTQPEIQAQRLDLAISGTTVQPQPLPHAPVDIVIARDPQHPETLDASVDRVLSAGIDRPFAETAPGYWQSWLYSYLHLAPPADPPFPGLVDVTNAPPPILRYAPDPAFSKTARDRNFGGISLISVVVDAAGLPHDIRITEPVGMGLDESAVLAVMQYRFSPATAHGQPVPVRINIAVSINNNP